MADWTGTTHHGLSRIARALWEIARFVADVWLSTASVGIFALVLGAAYHWASGRQINWVALAILGATFGLFGSIGVGVEQRLGKSAIAGESRFNSYLRVIVPAVFGLPALVTLLLIILFSLLSLAGQEARFSNVDVATAIAFVIGAALCIGILNGFLVTCTHAFKRREFLALVVIGTVLQGALVGAGLLFWAAWGWFKLERGIDLPFGSFPTVFATGAILGIAFELWRRFGRGRGRMSAGDPIDMLAEAAGRGKVIVVGLWYGAIGFVLLWWSVPPLLDALNNNAAAGDWVLPIAGTSVGGYLFLARGVGPIWNALRWSRLGTDTHGQARWATIGELRKAGLAPCKNGIYLGQFLEKGMAIDTVGYPGPVHLITIGPNNAGKGTGLIIPNLAKLRRSIFIIDPKGEAAAITARTRAKFGPVKIINPFNVLVDKQPYLRSVGFNPLAALDPRSDDFTDDCIGIAQALVKEQVGSDGAFFAGSAQDLLTALIMHEKIVRGPRASLANVRRMLTERWGVDEKEGLSGLAETVRQMSESTYEPLRAKATRFRSSSKSNMDIISTATNETRLLDSPALQRDLTGEAINWDSMKEEITTVYLILPSDRLETHANFLRLVVTSALRTLLRSPPSATLPPVLFMLDEFAQLGYLPSIENAMGIARGFGVQLWPFLQDLNQLHALYKDRWQTFIGARGVLTAFAPKDMFTADYLSRLCGNKTVIVESENIRPDQGLPGGVHGPQGLPLIRPEELMGMPAGQMLCFAAPVQYPFMTKAPGYWETVFNRDLDANPYHPT